MEWLKLLAPLLGVLLGWGLSERSTISATKREDTRQLKRLLFYLLELRFILSRIFEIHKFLDDYFNILEEKIGANIETEINQFKPVILEGLRSHIIDHNKVEFLEKNVDKAIKDLSEIFPIFAYELNGQHKVKEKLQDLDRYFNEVAPWVEQLPFDLKEWLKPKVTDELLGRLEENILMLARKIGRKTLKATKKKIKKMNDIDRADVDKFLQEYLNKVFQEKTQ